MRTTLDIDNDILELAKSLAAHRKESIGRVISDLCRKNLRVAVPVGVKNGVHVIQRDETAAPVTLEIVNQLRDER